MKLLVAILVSIGVLAGLGLFFNKKKFEDIAPAQMRGVRILVFVLAAFTIFVRWSLMFGH